MQNFRSEALLFAQESQQQMFSSNVLVRKSLSLFGGIGKHALAFIAQWQIDRGRNLLTNRGMSLDLFADGFD